MFDLRIFVNCRMLGRPNESAVSILDFKLAPNELPTLSPISDGPIRDGHAAQQEFRHKKTETEQNFQRALCPAHRHRPSILHANRNQLHIAARMAAVRENPQSPPEEHFGRVRSREPLPRLCQLQMGLTGNQDQPHHIIVVKFIVIVVAHCHAIGPLQSA